MPGIPSVSPNESGAAIPRPAPSALCFQSCCPILCQSGVVPFAHAKQAPKATPACLARLPLAAVLPGNLTNFCGRRAEMGAASLDSLPGGFTGQPLWPLPTQAGAGGRWPERGAACEPPVGKKGRSNGSKRRSQAGARTPETPLPSNFMGPVAAFCPGAATPISEGGRRWGYFPGQGAEGLCSPRVVLLLAAVGWGWGGLWNCPGCCFLEKATGAAGGIAALHMCTLDPGQGLLQQLPPQGREPALWVKREERAAGRKAPSQRGTTQKELSRTSACSVVSIQSGVLFCTLCKPCQLWLSNSRLIIVAWRDTGWREGPSLERSIRPPSCRGGCLSAALPW